MSHKDWDLQEDNLLLRGLADVLAQQAQAAQAPNYRAIAKKLVNSLQRQFAGQGTPSNVTSPVASSLSIVNLSSIDNLLQYLATSKVEIDGVRIAYTPEEAQKMTQDQK